MKDKNFLYSDLGDLNLEISKRTKICFLGSEMKTLQEIAEIKRKVKADWECDHLSSSCIFIQSGTSELSQSSNF